jgi:hypothetical protein
MPLDGDFFFLLQWQRASHLTARVGGHGGIVTEGAKSRPSSLAPSKAMALSVPLGWQRIAKRI